MKTEGFRTEFLGNHIDGFYRRDVGQWSFKVVNGPLKGLVGWQPRKKNAMSILRATIVSLMRKEELK